MWFAIAIICFVIFFIFSPVEGAKQKDKQKDPNKLQKIKQDEKDCILFKRIIHLGGHPSFTQEEKLVFKIREDKVFIEDWFMNKSEELTFENIVDYKIQTETELDQNTTVPRLLILGIFALVAQKKTKTVNQFLVLKLKQNNVEFECIFGKYNDSDNFSEIITELNRLRINNANNANNSKSKNNAV